MIYLSFTLWPYALLAVLAGLVIGWFTTENGEAASAED